MLYQDPTPSTSTSLQLTDKPTLDQVKTAIKTVLSECPNSDRKAASEWLEALKGSIHAWEICDQLLLANEGVDISYLAAHMLRQKISRNFNELPLEYYSSLKDSIVNHLQTNEDYAVQGQLTMAIADLTLLLQIWRNPIEDLAKQLNLDIGLMSIPQNDYAAVYRALHRRLVFGDILHQMCDLNHNHSDRPGRVGAKRREEYEDYLILKCSQAIVWWLNTLKELEELKTIYLSDNSAKQESEVAMRNKNLEIIDKLTGQIYLCYSAWLRIFDEENVNESLAIIDAAFKYLGDLYCPEKIHQYAVEVVVATAAFCEDNNAVDYLVNNLVVKVYDLEQTFKQCIAREDIEKAHNFAKVFNCVAETACLSHVINNKDFRLIELLLSCLNHYDFEVVGETYGFWWTLVDNLQTRLRPSEYGPYISYTNRFIMSVTKLCQFDPDEETVIQADQDINNFRAESTEIITNLMFITTPEDFLRDNLVLQNLKLDLSQISWEKVEAILYLISCLVQMMSRDENHIRLQIFEGVLSQQAHIDLPTLIKSKQVPLKIGIGAGEIHPQIIATSLKIIGSLETFLDQDQGYLAVAISYILSSISNPNYRAQLIRYAAAAFCNILDSKAERHFSSLPEFYEIMKELCANLDQFDNESSNELMRCSALLGSTFPDAESKDQFLCDIIRPIINSLDNTLNRSPDCDEKEPTKYLDRISVVFRNTTIHNMALPSHKGIVKLVDIELWPVILRCLKAYATKSDFVIERTCRTLRYVLRCIRPEWMIERVASTMVELYKSHPQNSSPLYICSILVDEFANKSKEINQGLFAMLEIFCELTFTLLNMNASQSQKLLTMKSYPETIDDMMRLFTRFMKKCPFEFVTCQALESIIELGIASLRIDHPDANINVTKFICEFIALGHGGTDHPHITDAIKKVLGARFTEAVIRACLFDIPSTLIAEEAQILLTLYTFDRYLFHTWVGETVSRLPTTNIQGIESVTQEQFEDFKKTITSTDNLKKIVNCLRAFARLYT